MKAVFAIALIFVLSAATFYAGQEYERHRPWHLDGSDGWRIDHRSDAVTYLHVDWKKVCDGRGENQSWWSDELR